MNDTKRLITNSLPPITPEFYNKLDEAFSNRPPTPDMSTNEIMFRAGQRSVVDWCKNSVASTHVYGEPQSYFQRLFTKYRRNS